MLEYECLLLQFRHHLATHTRNNELFLRRCQKQDWEIKHHDRCVDYQELIKPYITGEPMKQVAVAMNPACGSCNVSPIKDVVVLPECQHGFCFSCLKNCELISGSSTGMTCPMCSRISPVFKPDDPVLAEQKMTFVEGFLLQRAREFQRNGLRVDATEAERKENLNWAVAEIEKIADPDSYRDNGWEIPDCMKVKEYRDITIIHLLLDAHEYEKALVQIEVRLGYANFDQVDILEARLVEARAVNDRSGVTRYVIM